MNPLATPTRVWHAAGWAAIVWYAAVFGQITIWAGDTDLWYHLSGGAYTVAHGAPPAHTYFSFLEPPRPWVDYYWLFQVLVHRIHQGWGYAGLVAVRAALFAAFAAAALAACCPPTASGRRAVGPLPLVLFSAVILYFAGRYLLLRPHAVSYLAVLALCGLFRVRGLRALAAPALVLAWVNLHGIYYPVILLICLAYLAEYLWERTRNRPFEPARDLPHLAGLGLAMAAVLATPYGLALMPVPFVDIGYATDYIAELRAIDLGGLLSPSLNGLVPTPAMLLGLVVLAAVAALGKTAWRGDGRVSSVLLCLGGAALAARSGRFAYEFVLLSLPLLRDAMGATSDGAVIRGSFRARFSLSLAVLGALAIVHALAGRAFLDVGSGRFPVSTEGLPAGATQFLREVGEGGKVLNHHNTGGYVRWELYPAYRIFMDMEVPFAFTDGDMFTSLHVWHDEAVFARTAARYRPEYLLAPRSSRGFGAIVAKHDRYRLVYLDDVEAVYADREQRPEVVTRYALTALNPFALEGERLQALVTGAGAERVRAEARQLVQFHPGSGIGNQLLALLAKSDEDYGEMEARAAAIVQEYPRSAMGHKLRGDALRAAGRPVEALAAYREAERRADGSTQQSIWKEMAACHEALGDAEKAYGYLARAVTPHAAETTYRDLYLRGAAAVLTGRVEEGLTLFRWSLEKTPALATEHRERVEKSLAAFGAAPEE